MPRPVSTWYSSTSGRWNSEPEGVEQSIALLADLLPESLQNIETAIDELREAIENRP